MEIRVCVDNVEREWEVLVLAHLEFVVLDLSRLGVELVLLLVTWLAFYEELVIHGRNVLVERGLVEDLVEIHLALLAPANQIMETAALEPHLVLLLLHHVLEGKFVADLA